MNAKSKKLELTGINDIFATIETGCPWNIEREVSMESSNVPGGQNSVGMSLESWIGLWVKFFLEDPKLAFKHLVYIGYVGKMKDVLVIKRSSPRDVRSLAHRQFFQCFVIGSSGSGKSAFLDAFIHADHIENDIAN